MAVTTAYEPLIFNGNGATTAFSVTWPFFDAADLKVTLIDSSGVEALKTISTHYTVTGGKSASTGLPGTGTITMLTAPATGAQLRIERDTTNTQTTTWSLAGQFSSRVLEAELDRRTLVDQERAYATSSGPAIDGTPLLLETSGAVDYWDGRGLPAQNFAPTTTADGLVTYGQFQDALLAAGAGDVVGPPSSTDGQLVAFDGTTGKLLQAGPSIADIRSYSVPEDFGAVGNGVTDDAVALLAWVADAKTSKRVLMLTPGKRYVTTESLWLGSDSAVNAVLGLFGNGAEIIGKCTGKPILDMTGIENGRRVAIKDIRLTGDASNPPSCAILQARPKQAVGVKSSGYATLFNVHAFGAYGVAAYYNVQSEGNDIIACNFYSQLGPGMAFVRKDYFRDTFMLTWDAETSAFTAGLVVTGSTSGATAKIISPVSSDGTVGKALVLVTSGTFVDNETITDTSTGSATTNLPNGYIKQGVASPNTTLGVEEGSTCTWQNVRKVLVNNQDTTSPLPTVMVVDWNDIILSDMDLNHQNPTGTQLAFISDRTRDPTNTIGVSATLMHPYLHATHGISVAIGDPVSAGGSYSNMKLDCFSSAGVPSEARLKVVGSGISINDSHIIADQTVDLRGCNFQGNSRLELRDRFNGVLLADGILDGVLTATLAADLSGVTSSDGQRKWTEQFVDSGMSSFGRRASTVIASGAITATRPMMLVDTEASAATDDLTTINVGQAVNGQLITLRAVNAARVPTIRINTGNIRGRADVALSSTARTCTLVYDATVSLWYILSDGGSPASPQVTARTVSQLGSLTPKIGDLYIASDGRKNGEGAGAGTGVLVFGDGTNWIAVDTGATVEA